MQALGLVRISKTQVPFEFWVEKNLEHFSMFFTSMLFFW